VVKTDQYAKSLKLSINYANYYGSKYESTRKFPHMFNLYSHIRYGCRGYGVIGNLPSAASSTKKLPLPSASKGWGGLDDSLTTYVFDPDGTRSSISLFGSHSS
jgi:hypothetical protein